MKSKVMERLVEHNKVLTKDSWVNYQQFLDLVLQNFPGERGLEGLKHLRARDFESLLSWADSLATTEYPSPAEHLLCCQIASLIRKYPFPPNVITDTRRDKALAVFRSAEHHCSWINRRFLCFDRVRSPDEQALQSARAYISYVLGPLELGDVWEGCGFSAGASLGVNGDRTNLARKLQSEVWTVTPGAYHYASAAMKTDLHVFELLNGSAERGRFFCVDPEAFNRAFALKAKLVKHNKISFVPKDARVHRTIATEPLLNGYLQKGVDILMRKRLKRVGLDLRDQYRNQEFARKGSLLSGPGGYCTIDLSSASDSVSTELCRSLLPPDWFDFLNSIRSHSYKLDGEVYPYSKFVSMGNGFCFPLETLIFSALCWAAGARLDGRAHFCAYGDDLIVQQTAFKELTRLLKVCGFKLNKKKTFSQGPFRESCGADWYSGVDVRPLILDYAFDSFENIAKFCNASISKDGWNAILSPARDFLFSLVPPSLRLVRPFTGNPDTCLEVSMDVFMSSPFARFERNTQSWSWLEIIKSAEPDDTVSRHARYHVVLMAGALRGAFSYCPFAVRYKNRTKIKRVRNWGFAPSAEYPS